MIQKQYSVYILASCPRGAIYVGFTSDLALRISEHQSGQIPGHAKRYGIHRLVYYEIFDDAANAIAFEKKIKRWRRAWKDALIEKDNQDWADLSDEVHVL